MPLPKPYAPILCYHACQSACSSHLVIMEDEVDVPRSLGVVSDEVLVAGWALLFCVAREHAL